MSPFILIVAILTFIWIFHWWTLSQSVLPHGLTMAFCILFSGLVSFAFLPTQQTIPNDRVLIETYKNQAGNTELKIMFSGQEAYVKEPEHISAMLSNSLNYRFYLRRSIGLIFRSESVYLQYAYEPNSVRSINRRLALRQKELQNNNNIPLTCGGI